jgi:hypothetical protein
MGNTAEVLAFWELNNTPLELLVNVGERRHGLVRNQVEEAARRVYDEAEEVREETAEPSHLHSLGSLQRIMLARNRLKHERLGRRLFEVAKTVKPDFRAGRTAFEQDVLKRLDALEMRISRTFWEKFVNWSKFSRWE